MVKKRYGILLFTALATLIALSSCAGTLQDASISMLQERYRWIAEKTLPVVVEITTVEVTKQQVPNARGWPWDFIYPEDEIEEGETGPAEKEREYRSEGLGSGIIIGRNESAVWIVTNNHVVESADQIYVRLYDGRQFKAELQGFDLRKDIALLKIEADGEEFPIASIGDSSTLRTGDFVLAAGNPFGYAFSISTGVVSALHRSGPTDVSDFIQTDAAINQGNSGGALVNFKGEVIGINTWITTPTGGSIGLGFAVPINSAMRVVNDLIAYGEVRYAWLGASVSNMDIDMAESLSLASARGAFISQVFIDSPAVKSDILPGDVIVAVNKTPIESADSLIREIGELSPGDTVSFVLFRDGAERTVSVSLEARKTDADIVKNPYWPGVSVYPLTGEILEEMGLSGTDTGVLVYEAMHGAPFHKGGVRINDIIQSINDIPVNNLMDFYRIMNDKQSSEFRIVILRDGEQLITSIAGNG